jgi:hypothetical protein
MSGLHVQDVAFGDGLSLDPFVLPEWLARSEVDVGWGKIVDALVVSTLVLVGNERLGSHFFSRKMSQSLCQSDNRCRIFSLSTPDSEYLCFSTNKISARRRLDNIF